ncbi:hydroxyisourate hydrolase (plasmid) [Klebsiella sp. B345]|uniref:hydroxyisourate hydrolase n=1 Tax=Klebsiella sp. B345 TaxID=2755398 RepID=UPI003DA8CD7B
MSSLSTHILDVSTGMPAEGVEVRLEREGYTLSIKTTNDEGRVSAFTCEFLGPGRYSLTAETGDWFDRNGRNSVFIRAQIDFFIRGVPEEHLHLPFLIAPGG